jgi:xanthine permease XanP
MTQSQPHVSVDDPVESLGPSLFGDLIYGLNDKPPVIESLFVALQHVLASFVGIITPPLIICSTLEADAVTTSYIISMSLFVSGVATFIQCKRIGSVGSGLLSLQGTSFAFLGPIIATGTAAIASGETTEGALALIFGLCFFGSFVEVFLSQFLHLASRIITPVVSGTVVMIIGLSLIKTGIISMGGGVVAQQNGTFGSAQNLLLAGLVMAIIIAMNMFGNRYLRMGAIAIGLGVGYAVAAMLGLVNLGNLSNLPFLRLPIPFRYGMSFSFTAFIPFILLYLITAIETIGDLNRDLCRLQATRERPRLHATD